MFNAKKYVEELSHYFALGFATEFKSEKVIVFFNQISNTEFNFVYACVELQKGIYLDAQGVFVDLPNKLQNFKCTNLSKVEGYAQDMKEFLIKKLRVNCTNTQIKKEVREFLRNNSLVLDVFVNSVHYKMALRVSTINTHGITQWGMVQFVKGESLKFYHFFNKDSLVISVNDTTGFYKDIGWYNSK